MENHKKRGVGERKPTGVREDEGKERKGHLKMQIQIRGGASWEHVVLNDPQDSLPQPPPSLGGNVTLSQKPARPPLGKTTISALSPLGVPVTLTPLLLFCFPQH